MKPINEVYPEHAKDEAEDGSFYGPSDYNPLLNSLGFDILLKVDDDDYQGDSRLLLRDGQRFGVLIFGWGSCSGCDALQACQTMVEIDRLRNELFNSVKWFESSSECLEYFIEHNWKGDHSWHTNEQGCFIAEAKRLLESTT